MSKRILKNHIAVRPLTVPTKFGIEIFGGIDTIVKLSYQDFGVNLSLFSNLAFRHGRRWLVDLKDFRHSFLDNIRVSQVFKKMEGRSPPINQGWS